MSNTSSSILRLLGFGLLVTTVHGTDLSKIIWSPDDITNPAILGKFLKSNYGMAREWIRMSDDKTHLVMGKEGTYKLTECLEKMSKDRKPFQEIYLMVIWKADYDMAVKELELVPGAIKFVILSMRLWTGANGNPPKIKPVDMSTPETFSDGTRKSFGPEFAARTVRVGFSEELIRDMTADFEKYNFTLYSDLILSFCIFEIAMTSKELLDPLAKVMNKVHQLELTGYSANPPKDLDMDYFMHFFKANLKTENCYLYVMPDMREIIIQSLNPTTTEEVDTVSTEANEGGRAMVGFWLIAAMVLGLLKLWDNI